MKKLDTWIVVIINIELLLVLGPPIFEISLNLYTKIIIFIGLLALFNLLYIAIITIAKVILKKVEKRNKNRYSLYDWLGDPYIYLKFYDELINKKQINQLDFNRNYSLIKKIIKKYYSSYDEISALRIYLESRSKSSRLNQFMAAVKSIIVALIIPVAIGVFSIFTTNKSHLIWYSVGFLLLFFSLLILINFVSKEIDRQNNLLLIVKEMLNEMESKD